ncbi:hypothetical protein [Sphingopyxis sp.]|uniref:hypothetical protein n=1 Tax=Sphingopyxis sp. TaxID=1908224 RepID=UPI0025F7AFED|nr:hypothetical protein [Sphingopyxis sp.]MBR2174473.1 hypothetical protein [Sphingopyxis sp.]
MEIVFGFLGVLVGSAIPWIKEEWHQRRSRQENGQFFAVRITAALDEYAQKCVAVVSDDGTSEGRPAGRTEQGEVYYEAQTTSPEPPIFPDDIDWQSIPFKLMYRILALPNTARDTDRYIANSSEYSFPPDYDEFFSARQEGYAHLGLEALKLIEDLRNEFDFPDLPPKFWDWGWDSKAFFEEKLDHIQKRRQHNQIASVAMIAEVDSARGEANE